MRFTHRHKLVAAGATLAVAAGTGGALAATQNQSSPRQAFENDLAGRLHVSPQQLRSAMQGAFIDRLNAAVAAGRLTRAQANRIEQRVRQGRTPWLHLGGKHGHGARAGLVAAAASYLGLSRQQLTAQLRSGKSLAQVASAQGKSTDGLKAALTAAIKARLDKAVAAGRITSTQEQQRLQRLSSRLDQLINRQGVGHAAHRA